MTDGIQTIAENLGKTGCYFFCLCDVAEEYTGQKVDVLDTAIKSLNRGYITNEFYVQYPALILEMLTGKKWEVRHDRFPYPNPEKNEFVINRFEWKKTMNTLGHFERDKFESIIDCPTSLYGKPVSTRVCKVLN